MLVLTARPQAESAGTGGARLPRCSCCPARPCPGPRIPCVPLVALGRCAGPRALFAIPAPARPQAAPRAWQRGFPRPYMLTPLCLCAVPSDLTPEECQELENIRRRKQELLADIQVRCWGASSVAQCPCPGHSGLSLGKWDNPHPVAPSRVSRPAAGRGEGGPGEAALAGAVRSAYGWGRSTPNQRSPGRSRAVDRVYASVPFPWFLTAQEGSHGPSGAAGATEQGELGP